MFQVKNKKFLPLSELGFFLKGYKPAIIGVRKEKITFMKNNYPWCFMIHPTVKEQENYIKKAGETISLGKSQPYCNLGDLIFFQNETIKQQYLNYFKQDEQMDRRKALGYVLGYPPSAVEAFFEPRDERKQNDWLFINYCGLQFGTKRALIPSNIQWLLAQYPPKHRFYFSINQRTEEGKMIRLEEYTTLSSFLREKTAI